MLSRPAFPDFDPPESWIRPCTFLDAMLISQGDISMQNLTPVVPGFAPFVCSSPVLAFRIACCDI